MTDKQTVIVIEVAACLMVAATWFFPPKVILIILVVCVAGIGIHLIRMTNYVVKLNRENKRLLKKDK